jgi:hypothetical protein
MAQNYDWAHERRRRIKARTLLAELLEPHQGPRRVGGLTLNKAFVRSRQTLHRLVPRQAIEAIVRGGRVEIRDHIVHLLQRAAEALAVLLSE